MLETIRNNLGAYIPFFVSTFFMAILGGAIVYNDFKKLSVKTYMLLSLVGVGFLGVICGRITTGAWSWYWLLMIPVFFVLDFLTVRFVKNKFIGQADVTIINGVVAILVPIAIDLWGIASQTELASSLFVIRFGSVALNLLFMLMVGYILAIICGLIKWLINRSSSKKEVRDSTKFGNASIAAAVGIMSASNKFKGEVDHLKDLIKEDADDIKTKKSTKLRGTKLPICLAFIPMFILAVYTAIFGIY